MVTNYAIPEVEKKPIPDTGEKAGGSATTIKKETKTVKEIIDEINQKFREQLGEEGMTIVSNFFDDVSSDESLKAIVKNNLTQDSDQIYDEIVKDKLRDKLTERIMDVSPDKYADIMSDNVFRNIGRTAYKLLRDIVKVA